MASIRLKKLFKRAYFVKFFSVLLLGVGYVAYVLIGGVIFWQLEGDQVKSDIAALEQQKTKLLQIYPCLGQSGLVELGMVSYVKLCVFISFITYNRSTHGAQSDPIIGLDFQNISSVLWFTRLFRYCTSWIVRKPKGLYYIFYNMYSLTMYIQAGLCYLLVRNTDPETIHRLYHSLCSSQYSNFHANDQWMQLG